MGAIEEENSDSVIHESSNEQEFDVAGGSHDIESVGTKEEIDSSVGNEIGRRPKTQRKREQVNSFHLTVF